MLTQWWKSRAAGSPDPGSHAVEIDSVTYKFGDHRAVDNLSLVINAGECFGLLGPNGAGKTTTIRLLNTLLPLQDGDIRILGRSVRTEAMTIRRYLGYVPQQLSIESALTARENVTWFARLYDVPRSERRERVDQALEMVDLLDSGDRLASGFSRRYGATSRTCAGAGEPTVVAGARRTDGWGWIPLPANPSGSEWRRCRSSTA